MKKKKDQQPKEEALKDKEETVQKDSKQTESEKKPESQENKLKKQIEDLNDKYLRLVAEYDNFRKRTIKEKDSVYPQAQAETIAKFLPVLDNFNRALSFDHNTEDFAKGIQLIDQSFKDILTSFGVEEIGEVGEVFDPNMHNAVMHIDDPDLGENVVAQVFEKGYKIGDRIIRYATVQTAN